MSDGNCLSTKAAVIPAQETFDPIGATRSGLRDLAAFMALPAMWVDHDPHDIVSSLIGVLFEVLRLDYAYVRFSDPSHGPPLELSRPEGQSVPNEVELLAKANWHEERRVVTMILPGSLRTNTIRMTRMSPGLPGEDGLIIVGCRRDDFPTTFELYLLRVAAGQAAISIHTARKLKKERLARIAAEDALASRNELLGAIAEDVSGSLAILTESAGRARRLANECVLPAPLTVPTTTAISNSCPQIPASAPDLQFHLTRRETEVLGLLAQGLSNKEIAGLMWLSDRTVERHITGLYRKIGVERRSEATAFAMLHSLVRSTAT